MKDKTSDSKSAFRYRWRVQEQSHPAQVLGAEQNGSMDKADKATFVVRTKFEPVEFVLISIRQKNDPPFNSKVYYEIFCANSNRR
jgi:hypothetical protein